MDFVGLDVWESHRREAVFELKLLANERAVCIFPCQIEHRDVKLAGLSYEDNYQGNTIAAMVRPGRIEFRYHNQFSDARVVAIAERFYNAVRETFDGNLSISYHGRTVKEFVKS